MASTTSDLALLGRKLGAVDYNPDLYVKEIAQRCVGGHELLLQRNNIKVGLYPLLFNYSVFSKLNGYFFNVAREELRRNEIHSCVTHPSLEFSNDVFIF